MKSELKQKLSGLTAGLRDAWEKVSSNDFELPKKKFDEASRWVSERRNEAKERSQKLKKRTEEPSEGVTYYATENSPLFRGEPKAPAVGIDKFGGEKDEISPDLHH